MRIGLRRFALNGAVATTLVLAAATVIAPAYAQSAPPDPRAVQKALRDRGFDSGSVDGKWGPRSAQALRAFQRANNLPADAIWGAATAERLFPKAEPLPALAEPQRTMLPTETPKDESGGTQATSLPQVRQDDAPAPIESYAPVTPAAQPIAQVPVLPVLSPTSADRPVPVARPGSLGLVWAVVVGVALALALWAMRRRTDRTTRRSNAATTPSLPTSVTPASSPTNAPQAKPVWTAAPEDARLRERTHAYQQRAAETLKRQDLRKAPIVDAAGLTTASTDSSASELRAPDARGNDASWIARGVPADVRGRTVRGGLFYLGERLPRQHRDANDACLIDSRLKVAQRADVAAAHVDPSALSYAQLSPSSRKAFLDWLDGPRSDPATNIGYVFLYLFGLERRLMLDDAPAERDAIVAEVRRLCEVYADDPPFVRAATALLDAWLIRIGDFSEAASLPATPGAISRPLLVAMAMLARDRQPASFNMLFAFVSGHPETRIRMPARRAPAELRKLFISGCEKAFPNGAWFGDLASAPPLDRLYRAASGGFEVDVLPKGLQLRDVSAIAEPLGAARLIYEESIEALDAYSRELGRSEGLKPTLTAVSLLPASLRVEAAGALDGAPIAKLARMAADAEPVSAAEFTDRLNLPSPKPLSKGVLREWAQLLGAFGYAFTADPGFALRPMRMEGRFIVFSDDTRDAGRPGSTDALRSSQITVALAMALASADKTLSASELDFITGLVAAAPELTDSDRRRLLAEMKALSVDPLSASEVQSLVKTAPAEARRKLADDLVALAAIDGVISPPEAALIERLFKQIGIDVTVGYAALHEALTRKVAAGTVAALGPSSDRKRIDASRLEEIRRQSAEASRLLGSIFAEPEPELALPPPKELSERSLEGKIAVFARIVGERDNWRRADLEARARGLGLMPSAALAELNEWSLNQNDAPLLEGDDPLYVNVDLLPAAEIRVSA